MQFAESPVFHLLLLTAGMGLCVYLFVSLKYDIFRLDRRGRKAEQFLELVVSEQKDTAAISYQEQGQAICALRQELKEVAERVSLLTPSTPRANGIHLGKRTQVLQLARRGNRSDQIAACLQVPQNEVDLVLKVHRMVIKSF